MARQLRAGVVWANTFNRFDPASPFGGTASPASAGRAAARAWPPTSPPDCGIGGGAPHGPRNVSPMNGGPIVLAEADWRSRAAAHRQRVRRFTTPHRERKQRGEAHPVLDFLFTYYSHRPARLEEWHPGPSVVLLGAEEYLERPGYTAADNGVRLDLTALPGSHRPPGSCTPSSPPPQAVHLG